jgi:hypothetical protein
MAWRGHYVVAVRGGVPGGGLTGDARMARPMKRASTVQGHPMGTVMEARAYLGGGLTGRWQRTVARWSPSTVGVRRWSSVTDKVVLQLGEKVGVRFTRENGAATHRGNDSPNEVDRSGARAQNPARR